MVVRAPQSGCAGDDTLVNGVAFTRQTGPRRRQEPTMGHQLAGRRARDHEHGHDHAHDHDHDARPRPRPWPRARAPGHGAGPRASRPLRLLRRPLARRHRPDRRRPGGQPGGAAHARHQPGRPRCDGAAAGHRGRLLRVGGPAGRRTAQRRRRPDRGAAAGRLHPRPAPGQPPLHLRLRTGRGPGRPVRRARHGAVVGPRGLRGGHPTAQPASGLPPVVGGCGGGRGLRRQRGRRPVPHPHRPSDRLRRPRRRRAARSHRRAHQPRRAARRRRCRTGLALGRPGRRPRHHRGDRGQPAFGRHPGRCPAHGCRRPGSWSTARPRP